MKEQELGRLKERERKRERERERRKRETGMKKLKWMTKEKSFSHKTNKQFMQK